MKAWLAKIMATLCLKCAGWLCRRQHLKIVYSGDNDKDLHIIVDASSGEVTSQRGVDQSQKSEEFRIKEDSQNVQ